MGATGSTSIFTKLAPYRKFVVAGFGAAVVILGRQFGVDSTIVLDLVTVGTALSVYAVPNE